MTETEKRDLERFRTKAQMRLWLSEAWGGYDHNEKPITRSSNPHDINHVNGLLYVRWRKGDKTAQIIETNSLHGDICGDVVVENSPFAKKVPFQNHKGGCDHIVWSIKHPCQACEFTSDVCGIEAKDKELTLKENNAKEPNAGVGIKGDDITMTEQDKKAHIEQSLYAYANSGQKSTSPQAVGYTYRKVWFQTDKTGQKRELVWEAEPGRYFDTVSIYLQDSDGLQLWIADVENEATAKTLILHLEDTNGLTMEAYIALNKLDQGFVGTGDYMGRAYFWSYEYRHYLRDTTDAKRRAVHSAFMEQGLELRADSDQHLKIIKDIIPEDSLFGGWNKGKKVNTKSQNRGHAGQIDFVPRRPD